MMRAGKEYLTREHRFRSEHFLIGESVQGPITAAQVAELGEEIFACGHCSTDVTTVYHNRAGRHRHVRTRVPAQPRTD